MKTKTILILFFLCFISLEIVADTHYVSPNGGNVSPFDTWEKAAHIIQDAVVVASSNDIVLVTNGTYSTGGAVTPGFSLTNRVMINKPITLKSVNGPNVTTIAGHQDDGFFNRINIRAVYMTNHAKLIGFTLTSGGTKYSGNTIYNQSGGGLLIEGSCIITNCIVSNNKAKQGCGIYCNGAQIANCEIINNSRSMFDYSLRYNESGGGIYCTNGVVNNCIVTDNELQRGGGIFCINSSINNCMINNNSVSWNASWVGDGNGGGVYCNESIFNNCTIINNHAQEKGGGIFHKGNSFFYNSIIYNNYATNSQNYANYNDSGTYEYCCTFPFIEGEGNITNNPEFIDTANGDFHLFESSLCIDSGTNMSWMWSVTDLDGNDRIINGTVDIGAYEAIPEISVTGYQLSIIGFLFFFLKNKSIKTIIHG